jgi:hypothetical protein
VSGEAFDDVSLLCCSYNQRTILHRMLQSFVYHHPGVRFRALIVENSVDDDVSDFLRRHDVPYWRNDTGDARHSPSVDLGLGRIRTKYALLCDTDIVIRRSIGRLLRMLMDNGVDVAGVLQGDRGGYVLHHRISPHFCLVNLESVTRNGIAFHDQERVERTGSNGFFDHVPLQRSDGRPHYDCGGTFYEDCVNKHLRIAPINGLDRYVFHAESLSWAERANHELWTRRRAMFMHASAPYRDVDIRGRFVP